MMLILLFVLNAKIFSFKLSLVKIYNKSADDNDDNDDCDDINDDDDDTILKSRVTSII